MDESPQTWVKPDNSKKDDEMLIGVEKNERSYDEMWFLILHLN